MTDDIDGSADAEEILFCYRGKSYVIDLSVDNAAAFALALKPYLEAATELTSPAARRRAKLASAQMTRSGGRKLTAADVAAVRDWALAHGFEVGARVGMPKSAMDAYQARARASPGVPED